ncbi:hypothetical protein GDO81_010167 [Engystomops pustulosus]|uniref:Uncharacterized protein n=1 Tax=Engystomops pustulosus TaxID=76066 RepID=A0AAV7BYF5_ENGPU|nr:hypothetical protein GDO81_010167 [Engystomops pustulosus]
MKKILHPTPPVTTLVVAPAENKLNLPAGVQLQEGALTTQKAIDAISVFNQDELNDNLLNSVGKMLLSIEKLVNRKTRNCIALSPNIALSAAVAIKEASLLGSKRAFFVTVGNMDIEPEMTNDGKTMCLTIFGEKEVERTPSQYHTFFKWNEPCYIHCHMTSYPPMNLTRSVNKIVS